MPCPVRPVAFPGVPTFELTLFLSPQELAVLRDWANEQAQAEFELAQDLLELDRPHHNEAWRASFALQLACVLDALTPA